MGKLKNFLKRKIEEKKLSLSQLTTASILLGMVAIYITSVILYNIFEYKFFEFTTLGWSILGNPIIIGMGAGTLISWISFLLMDVITEVWGKKKAISIFTMAMIISVVTSLFGLIIVNVGTDSYGSAIELIFGTHIRVTLASAFAFWVGNYVNAVIMHVMKVRAEDQGEGYNGKLFALRATTSTLFGQFVDNALFQILGLAPFGVGYMLASPFGWTWGMVFGSIIVGTILEFLLEAVLVPLVTIPLSNVLKRKKEKEDNDNFLQPQIETE